MRHLLIISAFIASLVANSSGIAMEKEVLSVSLTCKENSDYIYDGQDVTIDVHVKNISDEEIGFPIEFVRKRGVTVTLIDTQTKREQVLPISPGRADLVNKFTSIKPGDSFSISVTLYASQIDSFRKDFVDLIVQVAPAAKIKVPGKAPEYSYASGRIIIHGADAKNAMPPPSSRGNRNLQP